MLLWSIKENSSCLCTTEWLRALQEALVSQSSFRQIILLGFFRVPRDFLLDHLCIKWSLQTWETLLNKHTDMEIHTHTNKRGKIPHPRHHFAIFLFEGKNRSATCPPPWSSCSNCSGYPSDFLSEGTTRGSCCLCTTRCNYVYLARPSGTQGWADKVQWVLAYCTSDKVCNYMWHCGHRPCHGLWVAFY